MISRRQLKRALLLGLTGLLCILAVAGCSDSGTTTNSSGPAIPPSGDLPIMYEFYTDW
ncbi:MAG: hypothetical protein PF636_01025 [Actinomycetota bacterium]|nr:hypothetical protein [Actinomycetota bacterium]